MIAETTKPLILVDGSSYLYRAFHALPSLTNSKGFPTGAIYGMINMLKRLLADYQPEYMAVVFDAKGKTFRDELFEHYKATRSAMPDELARQIAPLHAVIQAMGLPILMVDGVEADDVIGTLAQKASQMNVKTIISTSDKDLAQLVDSQVTLVNTMSNSILDVLGVEAKFGVPPSRIIDYLTLVGDTSDNIPGVPQVGPKTAVKWLKEYGSLEGIIHHAAQISGKVGENLRASLAQLPWVRNLVTIKLDVHLPITLAELSIKAPDKVELVKRFTELEFRTWLSELLVNAPPSGTADKFAQYETVLTDAELQQWLGQIKQADHFALSLETTNLDYFTAQIVGVALAIDREKAAYIPLAHDYSGADKQLESSKVLKALAPLLADPAKKKIGHNLKFDVQVCMQNQLPILGLAFDTMLESYILESTGTNHALDSLALKYLGWRMIPYEDIAGKGSKQLTFNAVDLKKAAMCAAEDVDVALHLQQKLWPRIEHDPGLMKIYTEIEMPLLPVLARMEMNGVLIDAARLHTQSAELQKRLVELEEEAYRLATRPFNINSPKQLQEILFTVLKLPVIEKTPTGQPSTADGVLQELALEFALPKLIIEYRSLSKLISTYTERLPEQIHPLTGRVHTTYHQAATATGRLSSSNPNLQNIPVRTLEGRRIRKAFVAPPGYKILSADYSQIELRLMAHISKDENLLAAFAHDLDIHQATAAEVCGVPLNEVTQEMRRAAKAINFGIIYGMSAFGLAKQLGISRQSGQEYIDRYFQRYPGVRVYMDETRARAREQGYVSTLWGRRLYLPEINSRQIPRQKAAERAAINAPLQGSAADIIKLAMIRLDEWLSISGIDARMIMQVHDELVFEVAEKNLARVQQVVREKMTEVANLQVQLKVSIGTGHDWDEAAAH